MNTLTGPYHHYLNRGRYSELSELTRFAWFKRQAFPLSFLFVLGLCYYWRFSCRLHKVIRRFLWCVKLGRQKQSYQCQHMFFNVSLYCEINGGYSGLVVLFNSFCSEIGKNEQYFCFLPLRWRIEFLPSAVRSCLVKSNGTSAILLVPPPLFNPTVTKRFSCQE